jgi:predicted nucleic acid-binding protein
MMVGNNTIFIDTNVLVFASVVSAPLHTIARQTLVELNATGNNLWISRQVIREYLATLSRPQSFTIALSPEALKKDIEYFQNQFLIAEENFQVTQNLLDLIQKFTVGGRQIHDANIVATMQAYEIPQLLTHNVSDFKRFSNLINLIPLE